MSGLLGILGGGQLGLMLAQAAKDLGVRTRVLDPLENPCAATIAQHIRGDYTDRRALARFLGDEASRRVDAVTCEWESVPATTLEYLVPNVSVHPGPRSFSITSDRLLEKRLFESVGLDAAPFALVHAPGDLAGAIAEIGAPGILKRRSGGYDGRGQVRIERAGDANDSMFESIGSVPALYERVVPFVREVSVIGVRSQLGTKASWPPAENLHERGILVRSVSPAPGLSVEQASFLERAVFAVMDTLDHVGVLALELFEREDGSFAANEVAPRVHNTGHWSIEGAETSQFENHVRAVCAETAGTGIGPTKVAKPCGMINLIGSLPDESVLSELAGDGNTSVHLYGKEARPGRKIGHLTAVADDHDALRQRLDAIEHAVAPHRLFTGDSPPPARV